MRCVVLNLGTKEYLEALDIQRRLVELRRAGECDDLLLLLEHPPVITIGRSGGLDHILISYDDLARQGVQIVETNRGGNITYHGPGQLVGYPILSLENLRKDAHWYLRSLESVLMETVKRFGIPGERTKGRTGVWVNGEKIASIGVAIRHWVTMHGFALNIAPDLRHFDWINPCGYDDAVMTSFAKLRSAEEAELPQYEDVKANVVREVIQQFGAQFDRRMVEGKWGELSNV
ncbi:MAG: lipoyl(octanoyl) transferase [Armatimonadetes bacterium CG2_30_59_28]|nr:lipoyl(octanoyl) transferase LipB [Armatimonadota bacterium]OIO98904.1 MAG: lipoyl(octanoyl) transferase [Armatimonadetes bacterium CG2_30_59_28]PIU66751.1 MAG: octanoyltransferase [Armatimonadetes bacterium CG07_land_8_20_14_0_80_59_28]PIX42482.1 MAG: octanoyltransferase [Armatimonadetes bacterium CG_4_8_14_3_um_filter_58_9]PIY44125.1 MAG: octanoyltransferase [Armatimonadetes bacterium CG_4_10_14_3_um_filter_59_10]PJB62009.1 MAG: octanoyltransferase [Armatimonadetes bacterium CG_4_9_14_3_u